MKIVLKILKKISKLIETLNKIQLNKGHASKHNSKVRMDKLINYFHIYEFFK